MQSVHYILTSDNPTVNVPVPRGRYFTVAVNGTFTDPIYVQYDRGDGTYVAFTSGDTGMYDVPGERVFIQGGATDIIRISDINETSTEAHVVVTINPQL